MCVCVLFLQLADLYKSGKRLPRGNCSLNVYKMISRCWLFDPAARPTFDRLATELGDLLESILRQERGSAPQQLQQDNGYVPMERTSSQPGSNSSTNPHHNGVSPDDLNTQSSTV